MSVRRGQRLCVFAGQWHPLGDPRAYVVQTDTHIHTQQCSLAFVIVTVQRGLAGHCHLPRDLLGERECPPPLRTGDAGRPLVTHGIHEVRQFHLQWLIGRNLLLASLD